MVKKHQRTTWTPVILWIISLSLSLLYFVTNETRAVDEETPTPVPNPVSLPGPLYRYVYLGKELGNVGWSDVLPFLEGEEVCLTETYSFCEPQVIVDFYERFVELDTGKIIETFRMSDDRCIAFWQVPGQLGAYYIACPTPPDRSG